MSYPGYPPKGYPPFPGYPPAGQESSFPTACQYPYPSGFPPMVGGACPPAPSGGYPGAVGYPTTPGGYPAPGGYTGILNSEGAPAYPGGQGFAPTPVEQAFLAIYSMVVDQPRFQYQMAFLEDQLPTLASLLR